MLVRSNGRSRAIEIDHPLREQRLAVVDDGYLGSRRQSGRPFARKAQSISTGDQPRDLPLRFHLAQEPAALVVMLAACHGVPLEVSPAFQDDGKDHASAADLQDRIPLP